MTSQRSLPGLVVYRSGDATRRLAPFASGFGFVSREEAKAQNGRGDVFLHFSDLAPGPQSVSAQRPAFFVDTRCLDRTTWGVFGGRIAWVM